MWYKLSKLLVQSASLGRYSESIAKSIGSLAIADIKQKALKQFITTYVSIVNIQDAISKTNIPQEIKNNLIQSFGNLQEIRISLFASEFMNNKQIRSRGGELKIRGGKEIILVDLDFNYRTIADSKSFIGILQEIYSYIVPIIRHELEHYIQNNKVSPSGRNDNKHTFDYKDYVKMQDNPYGYYTNRSEKEAHVSHLYLKAKSKGIPFETELRNFIESQVFKTLYHEYLEQAQLSHFETEQGSMDFATKLARNQSEQIYHLYLEYGQRRYPVIQNKPF